MLISKIKTVTSSFSVFSYKDIPLNNLSVVQLGVNSRVQHPVALFLHPVALFVFCYAPCPFHLVVPFINVGIPHIVD